MTQSVGIVGLRYSLFLVTVFGGGLLVYWATAALPSSLAPLGRVLTLTLPIWVAGAQEGRHIAVLITRRLTWGEALRIAFQLVSAIAVVFAILFLVVLRDPPVGVVGDFPDQAVQLRIMAQNLAITLVLAWGAVWFGARSGAKTAQTSLTGETSS